MQLFWAAVRVLRRGPFAISVYRVRVVENVNTGVLLTGGRAAVCGSAGLGSLRDLSSRGRGRGARDRAGLALVPPDSRQVSVLTPYGCPRSSFYYYNRVSTLSYFFILYFNKFVLNFKFIFRFVFF